MLFFSQIDRWRRTLALIFCFFSHNDITQSNRKAIADEGKYVKLIALCRNFSLNYLFFFFYHVVFFYFGFDFL